MSAFLDLFRALGAPEIGFNVHYLPRRLDLEKGSIGSQQNFQPNMLRKPNIGILLLNPA